MTMSAAFWYSHDDMGLLDHLQMIPLNISYNFDYNDNTLFNTFLASIIVALNIIKP